MKPYKPVKVYKWYSKDKYKIYVFDTSKKEKNEGEIIIEENIYTDDNIEDGLNKIALYIKKKENKKEEKFKYYCWIKERSLTHKIIEKKWDGYRINPFMSVDIKSKKIEEEIKYEFNTNELFNLTILNIVYDYDIIEELKENKYYFIEKKIGSYENYKLKDKKLNELITKDTKLIKRINERYNRVDFYTKLKKKIILSDLFDKLNTKNNIALIQWINDNSKILYKLQKKHYIKKEQLTNWCKIEKITNINCINIYYIIATGCYCKIIINNLGEIIYQYNFDIRKNINWGVINKTKIILTNYLKKYINENIKLKEDSLKLNLSLETDNTTLNDVGNKIGKYIDIFSINKGENKDKKELICIYKRSIKYNENLNITDYIKTKYDMGISVNEIIYELINIGYDENEAKNEVENVVENIRYEIEPKKKKKDNGTIVIITKSNIGFDLEIINSANQEELNYLLFWLTKIISLAKLIVKKKDKVKDIEKEKINEETDKENEILKYDIDIDDEKLGELDYNIDSDDELLGGAIGKEKHSYFVDLIRNVDKDLVSDNYARDKCQSDFQPVVLTKSEKETLEKNKQTYWDNIIEYGSNKNNLNYYICPRLWCPISKIPLDVNSENYECPLENEEPIKRFWGQDKDKKRYIKLIKPNEKGICAPCCGKKIQKKEELDKCKIKDDNYILNEDDENRKKKDKDEIIEDLTAKIDKNNYLMNQKAPIPNNRHGSISEKLHNILTKSIKYENCNKIINKTTDCYVRKGIIHKSQKNNIMIKNDSLIYAISNLLGYENKRKFINDIKEKLNIVNFISLENGEVCKEFMNMIELIPEDNEKLIKKIYNKKDILSILNFDNENNLSKSRLLNIYNSYNKFINYLSCDDYPNEKNSFYLYSLIATLYNKLLIIWENDNDDLKIICPLYTSYEDILSNLDMNPELLMLLKDGNYYEPIVLKNINDTKNVIKLNDNKKILKIIKECNNFNDSKLSNIYNKIYTLNQFIITKGKDFYNYEIKTLLLNNDLTISYILTSSNILLNFDKISISLVPKFIKDMNIKEIKFYDDINEDIKINRINIKNYRLFTDKCDSLNIKYLIGNIVDNNKIYFNSKLKLFKEKLSNNNIIHINSKNKYYEYIEYENKTSYNWFKLQKLVANILAKNYDDDKFNKIYYNLDKLEKINKIYNKYFKKYKNKNIISIILEELPIDNFKPITNIIKWINNIIIYYKYDFMSYLIKENKMELIFSQNVFYINNKFDIPFILLNFHDYMPNTINNFIDINKDFIVKDNIDELKLPDFFVGEKDLLPTKWRIKIKSKFSNYIIIKNNYTKKLFIDFISWLSNYLNIIISYDEINNIVINYYKDFILDKKNIKYLLNDPSFYNRWLYFDNRKKINANRYITDYYNKYNDDKIIELFNKVIKNTDLLYPNDITIKVISDIFNISILLIHRIPYGITTDKDKRNEYSDLKLSSTFMSATKNRDERPIFILNKIDRENYIEYNPIVENNDIITIKSLYNKFKYIPDNLKYLISLHNK